MERQNIAKTFKTLLFKGTNHIFKYSHFIKEVIEKYKDIVDVSVYSTNRRLFTPLTTKKRECYVPKLQIIQGSLFDNCATYIEDKYEDFDLRVKAVEQPAKKENKRISVEDEDIKDEDNANDNDKYLKLQKLIELLKEARSTNFDTWIKFNWCLINIGIKEGISPTKINRLIHQFSKLSKTNYDEDKVDEWISKNIDRIKETGYGWNYLYQTCIKETSVECF